MQLWRSEEKHVVPEARGVFPNHTSCSNKGYYLPLQTLSGLSFPSWIKITESSMINFPILYFPSLSAFSWPPAFLPGCKTRAAGLDPTRAGTSQTSPKNSPMTFGMWFPLAQWTEALSKVPGGGWGASGHPTSPCQSPQSFGGQSKPLQICPARLFLGHWEWVRTYLTFFLTPDPKTFCGLVIIPSHTFKLKQGDWAMLAESCHQHCDTKAQPVTSQGSAQVMLTPPRVSTWVSQGGLESKQG